MPICPNCERRADELLARCPSGDGYFCIDDAEYASFQGDAMLGTSISGRYVISGVIGRGAIGRVYKAHQLGVERDVVLKIFKVESIVDEEQGFQPGKTLIEAREDARERFVREAKVLGQLTHPNCVTLYDFGITEDGALLYIAMEFVAGHSMRQAVLRGLKPHAILEIMKQVLSALREAHALSIVHRDLKPENIILSFRKESNEPVVKVLDFGIAKLVGKDSPIDSAHTSSGMLFGTPAYMSPEQCRGASDLVGPPSDIYAFGCMCFELVTGRLPFEGRSPQQLIMMHQDAEIPRVHLRAGLELPQGMEAFITRCLAKDPSERFTDAGRALKILNGLIDRWEPIEPPEDASDLVDTAEIQALRAESERVHAEAEARQLAPGQGAISTLQGDPLESLEGEALHPSSAAAPAARSMPDSAYRTIASSSSSRATKPVQGSPLKVNLMIGAALLVVLGFCVALFVFFYKNL